MYKKAAPASALAGILANPTIKAILEKLRDPNKRAYYAAMAGGGGGLAHGIAAGDDAKTTLMKGLGGAGGAATLTGLSNKYYKALRPYLRPAAITAGVGAGGAALGGGLGALSGGSDPEPQQGSIPPWMRQFNQPVPGIKPKEPSFGV